MVGQIQAEPLIHETHQTGSIKVADPISDFPRHGVCYGAFFSLKKSNQVKKACSHGAEVWWRWGCNGANNVQNEANLVRNQSDIVQIWCKRCAEMKQTLVQKWCRSVAGMVQKWCRNGAEVVQK